MRWFTATTLLPLACSLAITTAMPLLDEPSSPSSSSSSSSSTPDSTPRPWAQASAFHLSTNEAEVEASYTKFELLPALRDGELTSPLVFELQVNPTPNLHTKSVALNHRNLELNWWLNVRDYLWSSTPTDHQSLLISDKLGFPHTVDIVLEAVADDVLNSPPSSLSKSPNENITFHIDAVDDSPPGPSGVAGFTVIVDPIDSRRILSVTPLYASGIIEPGESDESDDSFMIPRPHHHGASNDAVGYDDHDSYNIEAELESLLLLEAQAGELHTTITAKKQAIAKCLKEHRDQVSLKHLLQQCDGIVCAAKVIAQRICDKMGILTAPSIGYARVQDPRLQTLIDLDDEKLGLLAGTETGDVSEKHPDAIRVSSMSSTAIQPLQVVVYPQNLLLKILGGIVAALGLTALFALIRQKCMSMRKRVERAADKEERRNARAYRRAARRAEMRRRWNAFVSAINCFKSPQEPRIEDYEEKRALILQDALLEQDLDAAEKGEIMEAEIRQLRNAHAIVSSLVGVDERRHDLSGLRNDPPPPMMPLPYTPATRSRASTATLPSYTSEILPDYRSRYTRTEAGSNSSSSSLRSSSVVVESLDLRSTVPSTNAGTHTGSTRSHSVGSSSDGSRRSRFTPNSSVIETSPRASEDTLRYFLRRSLDTNDL